MTIGVDEEVEAELTFGHFPSPENREPEIREPEIESLKKT
jgi:hypothetical protein